MTSSRKRFTDFSDEYPDLSDANLIAIDIETYDPKLSEEGAGVYRRDGFILGVSIATDTFADYYNIGHYDCNPKLRERNVAYIRYVMSLPIDKVGANISYDIDWLVNWIEFNADDYRRMSVNAKVKGKWYDIQVAEPLINENQKSFSLDTLAKKYLGIGKYKTEIDKFCEDNGWKGDARKYLYKMPYSLVKKYAIEDVRQPLAIFAEQKILMEKEGLIPVFELETALLPAVMSMRATGAIIDTRVRDKNMLLAQGQLDEANGRLLRNYGAVNYNSPYQLAKLLDDAGIGYERKLVYTNSQGVVMEINIVGDEAKAVVKYMKDKYSVTKEEMILVNKVTNYCPDAIHRCNPTIPSKFLEALDERINETDTDEKYSQVVEDLLFCRKADKIINTFLAGSLRNNVCPDGRIHPSIITVKSGDYASGMSGTVTGRFAMKNPNLQQIPSKGKNKYWGNMCRECFIPEKGHWFAKIDYSQVEYRILAHYALGSGAEHLRETYINDPHTDYHQYIQDMTGLARSYAKNLNFGCMYGMGISKMMLTFGWSRVFCEEVLSTYHGKAPYIKQTMRKASEVAEKRGYIKTISGRHSHMESRELLYKMMNKLIQGSAADIMKKAMIDIYESGIVGTGENQLKWHVTVHDELDVSVPKTSEGIRNLFKMKYLMEHAYELKVPLKAEIEIGNNWADVKLLDFDKLHVSPEEHKKFMPYFKEAMTKSFSFTQMKQDLFLQHVSDSSVVGQVYHITRACEDMEQARSAYKKANK